MKPAILAGLAACTVAFASHAAPVKLGKVQMEKVVAGRITTIQVNGGGNTPNGNANGVPTVSVNPVLFPPPGQN
jgi:hypothetical protein